MTEEALCAGIRSDARRVEYLLGEAEQMKFGRSSVLTERTMKPTFNSRTPGDSSVLNETLLIEIRLAEWCRFLVEEVQPGRKLGTDSREWCRWVAFNAALIAEREDAEDFAKALAVMRRRLDFTIGSRLGFEVEERRVSIRSAALKTGVKEDVLREWVAERAISPDRGRGGNQRVLMSEVRRHMAALEAEGSLPAS